MNKVQRNFQVESPFPKDETIEIKISLQKCLAKCHIKSQVILKILMKKHLLQ